MLIVEDGSGKPDAESYASVSDTTAYFQKVGDNAAWTAATPTAQEQALRAATSYLDSTYQARWLGTRSSGTQRLDWPRFGVVVDEYTLPQAPLPRQLQEATAELAASHLEAVAAGTGGLIPDVTDAPLMSKAVSVGTVSKSVTYATPSYGAKMTWYRQAELLVCRLLMPARLVRI